MVLSTEPTRGESIEEQQLIIPGFEMENKVLVYIMLKYAAGFRPSEIKVY